MASSAHRPRVFLDVSIGEEPVGRLTIELFADHAPKTCENFRQLCTGEHDGLSYAKSPFHRVIDEFMVQGGDIEKGNGKGTISIYGSEFEDENLGWREMDTAGLICSANRGKNTNGSQFFITLEPCPHLNGKHIIFGHLVSGEDTLQRIAKVDVDKNDSPLEPVLISRCGELEKRKKRAAPRADLTAQSQSRDRGRRRRSNSHDVEMVNSPEPSRPQQYRRRSDNAPDEGIRGRPRQRSNSHSDSRPLSDHDEEDDNDESDRGSPATKHKRKRSPSPSRHANSGEYERRRRSLPNQYGDERFHRRQEDEDRYKPSPRRDGYRHQGQRRDRPNRGDRYQPSRDRNPYDDDGDGTLGPRGYDGFDPPVRFKGRGVMKYREPDGAW